jgi:hypothetical protein
VSMLPHEMPAEFPPPKSEHQDFPSVKCQMCPRGRVVQRSMESVTSHRAGWDRPSAWGLAHSSQRASSVWYRGPQCCAGGRGWCKDLN